MSRVTVVGRLFPSRRGWMTRRELLVNDGALRTQLIQAREALERIRDWDEGSGPFTGTHAAAAVQIADAALTSSEKEKSQQLIEFDLLDEDGESRFDQPLGFPAWMTRGACASEGQRIDDFMSEETSDGEQIDAITGKVLGAKRICAGCPVRPECLLWALTFEEVYGFRSGTFGGLCPSERVFAAQASDPIAFGMALLDEQVTLGLVLVPFELWEIADASSGE